MFLRLGMKTSAKPAKPRWESWPDLCSLCSLCSLCIALVASVSTFLLWLQPLNFSRFSLCLCAFGFFGMLVSSLRIIRKICASTWKLSQPPSMLFCIFPWTFTTRASLGIHWSCFLARKLSQLTCSYRSTCHTAWDAVNFNSLPFPAKYREYI